MIPQSLPARFRQIVHRLKIVRFPGEKPIAHLSQPKRREIQRAENFFQFAFRVIEKKRGQSHFGEVLNRFILLTKNGPISGLIHRTVNQTQKLGFGQAELSGHLGEERRTNGGS